MIGMSRYFLRIASLMMIFTLAACASLPQTTNTPTAPGVPVTSGAQTASPVVSTAVVAGTAVPGFTPAASTSPTEPGPTPSNLVVSRDDSGQTLRISVGQTFLLNLGEEYRWTVTVSDQNVLTREVNILVIRGAQGIYRALSPGQATLSAVGDAACREQKPPCMIPSAVFEITVIVQ